MGLDPVLRQMVLTLVLCVLVGRRQRFYSQREERLQVPDMERKLHTVYIRQVDKQISHPWHHEVGNTVVELRIPLTTVMCRDTQSLAQELLQLRSR